MASTILGVMSLTTMHALIKTELSGETSAFTSEGKLTMNYGSPYVAWGFSVKDLEEWLTTLEETMLKDDNVANRRIMEKLYFSLKAAHNQHLRDHDDVVTNAPTADDLMQYLASYTASLNSY